MKNIKTLFASIIAFLLPQRCTLCHREGNFSTDLCPDCYDLLPHLNTSCEICAFPLSQTGICGQCLKEKPYFDKTVAIFRYVNPVDKLIIALKFQHKLAFAKLLSDLFLKKLQQNAIELRNYDVIIPVPLHRDRLKQRGFNQALELARPIQKYLCLPIDNKSCRRVKATEAQSLLPAKQRFNNIKNAFSVNCEVSKKRIIVFDDVMTTGHTVNELSRQLKQKGATEVLICCIARTH